MGSQTISILTEGILASLTGGWYYDKKQHHFSNIFHLYIWLIFLCLPLVIQLFFNNYLSWLSYCIFIGSSFLIIKLINAYFHRIFDTGKCIKDDAVSGDLDATINSPSRNDADISKGNAFEMTTLSNSQDHNESNNNSSKFLDNEQNDILKSVKITTSLNEEECFNENKEVLPKTIDLQADVHCNDTDSSFANLSMLFRINSSDEELKNEEQELNSNNVQSTGDLEKSGNNKSCVDIVSKSDTFLSNINSVYSKANSSNNSIGVIDNITYEKTPKFRRARSELETTKHSDKYPKPTVLVPPSHPVSMEIINNSKNYTHGDEDTIPLDSSRFKKETSGKQNQFGCILDRRISTKQTNLPQTSKDSLEETGASFNLEKIEESQEKNSQPSATYIKAFDSSEDGDESEISLCTNESSKLKAISSRKLSKQPLRKARFSSNRKRKYPGNRTSYSDWMHKSIHDPVNEQRSRNKPNSIVLLSTSDEDDDDKNEIMTLSSLNDRFNSVNSDSSSFIPSSSSSTSSLDKKRPADYKIDTAEFSALNAPSTSTGISRDARKKHKRIPANVSNRSGKLDLVQRCDKTNDITTTNFRHFVSNYYRQMRQGIRAETDAGFNAMTMCQDPFMAAFAQEIETECSRNPNFNEKNSRSNSLKSTMAITSTNFLAEILNLPGTHLANSHEDTTSGSVHVFQDERGNWFSYTFDNNSTGLARGLCPINPYSKITENSDLFKSNALVPSNSIFYLNNCLSSSDPCKSSINHNNNNNEVANKDLTKIDPNLMSYGHSSQTPDSLNSSNHRNLFFDTNLFDSNFDPLRGFIVDPSNTSDFLNSLNNRRSQQLKQSQYYELNVFNLKTVKIRFDRLSLLAFLDRNITVSELVLSIVLAIFVAIFSSILLYKNFFHDLSLVLFCLVVASSQYTLLKSVQPDASSPTHGFNHITIYSRPIYFCIGSLILLLSNDYVNNYHTRNIAFEIYGINIFNRDLIGCIFSISRLFLLSFPFLFTFGFLPQINTFMMYVFEQVDIHIFGGTSSTMGMISATYSIIRSILAVSFLYFVAYILNIKDTQKASFSVFCGLLIAISYHVSRLPSDPSLYWSVVCSFILNIESFFNRLFSNGKNTNTNNSDSTASPLNPKKSESKEELTDPLPAKLNRITLSRLESDFIICIFIAISVFGVHVSSIFKLQPFVNNSTTILAIYWGFVLHYLIRQCRKQLPWLCFANPIFKSDEYKKFEVKRPAKIMCFEKVQAWFWLLEKNVIFPLVFLSYITSDAPLLIKNFGPNFGTFLLVLCGVKCIRSTFNDPSNNYIIIIFTHLFFSYDYKQINGNKDNIFLLNYFLASILFHKINDFLLKLRFVITYVAPWQITWGSAFHAFAQPFSVPHSAMLLVQIFVSSLLSSPLQPIFGSAIFFASYVRPIKFWERDYNTKRVDHSNTRLASQIDKAQIGSDDNNLNSIFYEHLTRSLQHSLYGDIILGRWGDVSQGDCFVLASDNLNCLIHIIELGNGLVTFQVRGLEFRGTYCQQREVEAISESVSDDEGCCCCEPGHVRGLLSINAAFNQRWLSWEVTHTNYVLEGYSISENSASTLLQPYDLRKALITYYIKSIIYYCITYQSFSKWLENEDLRESLSYLADPKFVDLDPTFNFNIDEDFDIMASGITRASFKSVYLEWIMYCMEQESDASKLEFIRKNEEFLISLCLGLSLLARRALGTASHHNSASMSVDFFLYGFHALFKGDFRVHCIRDEWVFQDMDFLDKVIAPSVRMALKLHQDQFTTYEEYENSQVLFDAITYYNKSIVISHEADPIWRNAILSNVHSLLALRHVFDDGTDQYKIIMLNKRFLNFRVIKINRECVRGLWAGQQQELIFLRNRNPERGSIQNAKQVLRNIINSSCDQPIGYPIYVSPLTTSFAETSVPLSQVIGPSLSISMFKRAIFGFFQKIRNRCSEVCSSSSGANDLTFNNARLSKSESSDRGIDDSICGKVTLLSSHPQLTQMSNYNRYMKERKKKALQEKNEEEISLQNSTLVNLPLNKSVLTLFANSINMPDSNISPSAASVGTNKLNTVESSFINIEQSKTVILEKTLHTKGEAV